MSVSGGSILRCEAGVIAATTDQSGTLPQPAPLSFWGRSRLVMGLWSRAFLASARFVYRWYEARLFHVVTTRPVPSHVGIILDGNRRFAQVSRLPTVADGHRLGSEKVREVLEWCNQLHIPAVTLWALSTDNFRRDPKELDAIFGVMEQGIDRFLQDAERQRLNRRVQAVGRLDALPDSLTGKFHQLAEQTAHLKGGFLYIAVAYGGRDEVVDAVRRLLDDQARKGFTPAQIASTLTPDCIERYLYTTDAPDPDLIIRTSGEVRLSGFLMWQSVHSELYFCDAFWPAFRKIDFLRAIRSYQSRHRRFGR